LELAAKYMDVFETDSIDYGQTDRVYHYIKAGEACPVRQPPRRLPSVKQAEVGMM
jgi:hypothetical protein